MNGSFNLQKFEFLYLAILIDFTSVNIVSNNGTLYLWHCVKSTLCADATWAPFMELFTWGSK